MNHTSTAGDDPPPITIIGQSTQTGTYILRLRILNDIVLSFGRFKRGAKIAIPAGEYVYIGSAMGKSGATTLARRLLRHATRSSNHHPHAIRQQMIAAFTAAELGTGDLLPRSQKTPHWHIDYLLDRPEANVTHVIILRSAKRLESVVADLLAAQSYTRQIESGLGASDAPGSTHLLGYKGGDAAWRALITELFQRLL